MEVFAHNSGKLSELITSVAGLKIPMPQLLNDRQQTERAKSEVKETEKEADQKEG